MIEKPTIEELSTPEGLLSFSQRVIAAQNKIDEKCQKLEAGLNSLKKKTSGKGKGKDKQK